MTDKQPVPRLGRQVIQDARLPRNELARVIQKPLAERVIGLEVHEPADTEQGEENRQASQEVVHHTPLPEMEAEVMADIASRLAKDGDNARLSVGCALLNTFNYAVQVQGNRKEWNQEDFRAFLIALASIDSIGAKTLADDVENQLRRRMA